MAPRVNVILGAGTIGDSAATPLAKFDTPEQVNEFLDIFYERGYRQIDTARLYAPGAPCSSEARLGAVSAGARFAIDSKVLFTGPGSHTTEKVRASVRDSLAALALPQLNIYYLHMPDRSVPFEDAHAALDEAFAAGQIRAFGLSNHTPEEVEQFVARATTNGLVKPTVYQGQYNPLVRGGEKTLFPLLRKHGIAFYAWSPATAGFFKGNLQTNNSTRFDKSHSVGELYSSLFDKPQLEALRQRIVAEAEAHNMSGHAAALRWTAYHGVLDYSLGDALVLGASKMEQMRENLAILDAGPLPEALAQAVGDLYRHVADAEITPWF